MNREDLEEQGEQEQQEREQEHGSRALRFLSSIFGHKKNVEVPDQPEAPQEAATYLPATEDYLGRLQAALAGVQELSGQSMEEHFALEGETLSGEQWTLVFRMQELAKTMLAALPPTEPLESESPGSAVEASAVEGDVEPEAPPSPAPDAPAETEQAERTPPTPEDARCELLLSKDAMTAWIFLLPPLFGGAEEIETNIRRALEEQSIIYGVDEAMLQRTEKERLYFKLIPIAHGRLPVDGTDGNVLDLIPRQLKLTYKENEDGTVDFKENNQYNHIKAGDIICEIIAPTEPTPGSDVMGRVLDGRPGKIPVVPGGKNTQLNEDGTQLTSLIDGQVSFFNGKFFVDSVVTISGDVDSSIGNLDVIGNVVISGDVLEGFTVKASADITVSGIVEGAKLIAGGNIQLNRGMNGNQHGVIKAKGNIVAQFLENSTAHARGDIHSQSIINCTVSSDGAIDVSKGRGVIIGGAVTACKSVESKIIGNASHRVTEIVLGSTPDFLQQQSKLIDELRDVREELEEASKNITYLERGAAMGSAQLTQLKLRLSVLHIQLAKKEQQLEEMSHMKDNMENCFVRSGVIYPGVRITMGLECRPVAETMHSCHIYSGPDGIVFSSK